MSLRRLVARTIGHTTSKSMRLISPAAELWIRALNDEVRRMAGDLGVPTKESYSVDRSPLEIIGEGNKGAATKSGGIEWERMSTSRLYYPGQCYEVDGIAPLVGLEKRLLERQSRSAPSLGSRAHRRLSNVLDFRNARLLNLFVSDAGKILPRRRSRLSAKIHRKAVKHMKTSRVMGISAVTERLQELTKRKKKD
mmetsp:Transcript_14491/g.62851  ORF Transcript_14491/g.62851 Transcript_14491/m.62851 type:complete len:195 (-) Transcript_14491:358-942(-)